MDSISILKNTIQTYAWGSYTAIPELTGEKTPSDTPQAELWMGAHPKSPSMVRHDGDWVSLAMLTEKYPEAILGKTVAEKYNKRLPYLLKVLAATKPLSLQAHPGSEQARQGFERENRLGIPLDAPNRNYKDDSHKPECICALTPFWGLNGFRKISDTLLLMEKLCPKRLEKEFDDLLNQPYSQGIKNLFHGLMTMSPERRKQVVGNAVVNAKKYLKDRPEFEWIIRLHNEYPSDIGVLSPVFLNLVRLEPGEAMFLESGELHAYLEGVGIELMANSDNVLRGGLTPKHVDIAELLQVLSFREENVGRLVREKISNCEEVYPARAEEFVLSFVSLERDMGAVQFSNTGPTILLCTQGSAILSDAGKNHDTDIRKGMSALVPAAVAAYQIRGDARFYKASVPQQ